MNAHTVFCSARDRNVSLVPGSSDWMCRIILDSRPAGGVACLDQFCTGVLCPFAAEAVGDTRWPTGRMPDPASN